MFLTNSNIPVCCLNKKPSYSFEIGSFGERKQSFVLQITDQLNECLFLSIHQGMGINSMSIFIYKCFLSKGAGK